MEGDNIVSAVHQVRTCTQFNTLSKATCFGSDLYMSRIYSAAQELTALMWALRRATNVWAYLRTSLTCAGRMDLLPAVEDQDLAKLQSELPL